MEHLPPSGWSDVARTHDIHRLDARIDGIEVRLGRIEEDLRGVRNSIRALAASMVAVSAAIIVLLIQLNQNISRL